MVGGGANRTVPMALEARSGKSACPDKNTTVSKPSFWLVLHFQRRMPPKADNLKLAAMEGRVGYVLDKNWLVYGTGGFAWSYDQSTRTQLAGGTQPPGTHRLRQPQRDFNVSGEAFNSSLSLQEVRLGLNYKLFADAPGQGDSLITMGPSLPTEQTRAIHGQTTFVEQYVAPFQAPYSGPNSLASNSGRETWDATAYLGLRLWDGAEAWINPEIDQGFGLSGTLGVAGFISSEAYKTGANYPYTRVQRAFIRQTISLGGETQKVDGGINQFAGEQTADRLVLTVGKFSVGDIFDANKYGTIRAAIS